MRFCCFVQQKNVSGLRKTATVQNLFSKAEANIVFQIAETLEMLTKFFGEVEHLQLKVISPSEIKSSSFKSDSQGSKFPPFIMKS